MRAASRSLAGGRGHRYRPFISCRGSKFRYFTAFTTKYSSPGRAARIGSDTGDVNRRRGLTDRADKSRGDSVIIADILMTAR